MKKSKDTFIVTLLCLYMLCMCNQSLFIYFIFTFYCKKTGQHKFEYIVITKTVFGNKSAHVWFYSGTRSRTPNQTVLIQIHIQEARTYFTHLYVHRKKGSRKWASNLKPCDQESN